MGIDKNQKSLAIVIPAYKPDFFELSLLSLVNQTNKYFTVYVGDDCSPYDLKKICDKFTDRLDINYHRFNNNIGPRLLVHQWNRCVSLVENEEWIWLFSDDDTADSTCVELFYENLNADKDLFDVYRFNTRIINDAGELLGETPESPHIDTSENMAYEILMGRRGNSMPDHIFSKKIFNECKGFVHTDYAQGADWATSILFSYAKGIKTIQGAKVNWRLGAKNITGNARLERRKKIKGHLQFLDWLYSFFFFKDTLKSKDEIIKAIEFNLKNIILSHYKGLGINSFGDIYAFYRRLNYNRLLSITKSLSLFLLTGINQVRKSLV